MGEWGPLCGSLQVTWFVGGSVCFRNPPLPDLPLPPTPLESFLCSFVALGCLSHSTQFVNSVHDFFNKVCYDVFMTFWLC